MARPHEAYFVPQLQRGQVGEDAIAEIARRHGWDVKSDPKPMAPSFDCDPQYSDTGDLILSRPGRRPLRVEVKYPRWRMDHPADPYICSKRSYDAYDPKPDFFVLIDGSGDYFALVRPETKRHWRVKTTRYRGNGGYDYEVYCISKEHLKFYPIPRDVKERILRA